MHDLRDHGKRANRARSDTRHEQKLRKVARTAFCGGCAIAMEAPRDDILGSNIMMVRHYQMREHQLALLWCALWGG
jgi:hypothetical protein